ncbi:Sterile alpha motif/pointed domain [Pseudocohnilembus persalinus]|uniref:Sterile alpha motif/pointed domain n=1 Tax=Pseudocohnilembus persalinus TaxID=266149 RepID=A0A0V0R0Z7_PSEPJ|nr:Sterile alpha motif/pointed domain [Pseudocohnilembus persalinus]|eukprot:KRX08199.1 Sterile alpha motif/pointed domain [Pseudocohnilembus persalinus]
MRPSVRGKSGSKKLQPSAILEKEAKEMEEKLKQLKRQMAGEKEKRNDVLNQSGSRWAGASTQKPIKNYSKKIIEEKNEYLQKTGKKLGGTASFSQNKNQNIQKASNLNMTQQPPLQRPGSKQKKQNIGILPNKNNFMDSQSQRSSQNQLSNSQLTEKGQVQQQQSIENNLQKHLQIQKGKEKDHIQFLKEINLTQYLEKFEENGFDDLETIIELNTELLNDMMIPAGHQIKIMKKVDKLRQEKNLAPQKEHILNQYKSSNYNKNNQNSLHPPKKRTDLVALEYEEPVAQKHSIAIGDEPSQPDTQKKQNSQFDGQFDEKESHKSFLEALMEWRGQKLSDQTQGTEEEMNIEKKKSVKFQDDVIDNEGKSEYRKPGGKLHKQNNSSGQQINTQKGKKQGGGLFFMGGEQNYDNDTYTTNQDSDTQTINQEIPVIHDKTGCWQCYKLFSQSQALANSNKLFCSQNCLNTFLSDQMNKQQKDKSVFQNGLYFCSEKCVANINVPELPNNNMEQQTLKKNQNKVNYNPQQNNIEINTDENKQKYESYKLEDDQINQLEKPFTQILKEDSSNSTNASILLNLDGNEKLNKQKKGVLSLQELENKYKQLNLQKSQIKNNKENYQMAQIGFTQDNDEEQDILADSLDIK